MKTLIFFLTILIVSKITIYPQQEGLAKSINKERVLNDFSKPALIDSTELDSIIISKMDANHIPGLAALITTKENGIIWKRNYGYANVELNRSVEDSTLFLIASMSKTILATAIMQFWEADSFDLDDNINDHLDKFQVTNPNHPNNPITIRMIMTHTSSIKDDFTLLYSLIFCGDSPITPDSLLINYFTPGGIYYSSSNFNSWVPGSNWDYSNVAACILAHLVEKFSGIPFDQYCRENIFIPLGMNQTSWFLEGLDTNNIATPYFWQGNQYIPFCHQGFPYCFVGQLRTNKFELEHFLSAYMNWGYYKGETILDSSTVDLILSDQLGYSVQGGYQGLLWYQEGELGNRLPWGHAGSWIGSNTGMFFKQVEDWGVILFMNSINVSELFYLLNTLCDYVQNITEVEGMSYTISDFYLEQNYPNPFNPNTTIRYQIPELSLVTLKVYDVLGNEIAILVNAEKPAGTYEGEFDGRGLSSGVYFYQLKAKEHIETRKMLLLK